MTHTPLPSQAAVAAAIHAVLLDDPHVRAELGEPPRLYDAVPDSPVHPYLHYGRMRTDDRSADEVRVETHICTLHLRSRYRGRAEVMGILAVVLRALSRDALRVRLPGVSGVVSRYTDSFAARDGHSRHSVLRLAVTVAADARMELAA